MEPIPVIFAPTVNAAIERFIDHVDLDDIPAALDFLERIQDRLVKTLGTFPEAGPGFDGAVRMFPLDGYVFLYEVHPEANEVHVLVMIAPGRHWR